MNNFTKKTRSISFTLGLLTLLGCAGMERAYQEEHCTESSGYERGMNDARSGNPMDLSFARLCGPSRDATQNGYRSGYTAGLASNQGQQPTNAINVNIGGMGIGVGVPNSGNNPKSFFCEVHAFTKKYSAWGSTELEAREKAKANCTRDYHEMHCEALTCKH